MLEEFIKELAAIVQVGVGWVEFALESVSASTYIVLLLKVAVVLDRRCCFCGWNVSGRRSESCLQRTRMPVREAG